MKSKALTAHTIVAIAAEILIAAVAVVGTIMVAKDIDEALD